MADSWRCFQRYVFDVCSKLVTHNPRLSSETCLLTVVTIFIVFPSEICLLGPISWQKMRTVSASVFVKDRVDRLGMFQTGRRELCLVVVWGLLGTVFDLFWGCVGIILGVYIFNLQKLLGACI